MTNQTSPYSVHPDCPDWRTLADHPQEAAIRALGDAVSADNAARPERWSKGFTRRQLLAGGLGVGVAALGTQLVTSRVAYAAGEAAGTSPSRTLVVVFLRGGLDGLSVVVPGGDARLVEARPDIAVRAASLLPFDRNFGLHPALSALKPMLDAGKIAAVPDIATPELTRSHFQAQDCLERGGTSAAGSQGWLDRVLEQAGPGTTFRSLSATATLPRSLAGGSGAVVAQTLRDLQIEANDDLRDRTRSALDALYTGLDHPFSVQAALALEADSTARALVATQAPDGEFPAGQFGHQLRTISTLITGDAGVRVATVDLGGWDMHTGIGTVDGGDMREALQDLGDGLAAFFASLGAKADSTTVVLMSEFGRRFEQNGSGGTDHGHGGLAIAMGGGVRGGVYGTWNGLDADTLAQGDLPGNNDFRNFLGEVVMGTVGLSESQMSSVFPDWRVAPSGLMTPV
ncbi:DUF1501 domain-containing protein [Microbacterium sp.]|uniref:DUF1501 domain-containing protein n=1 Tax=Microbacterium sp. TaxID=51671 RepID=UPI003A869B35